MGWKYWNKQVWVNITIVSLVDWWRHVWDVWACVTVLPRFTAWQGWTGHLPLPCATAGALWVSRLIPGVPCRRHTRYRRWVCLSVCLSVHLSILCLSVYVSSVYLSIYPLSIYHLPIFYMWSVICLPACLIFCLFVWLSSVHLFIYHICYIM